jgi:hypothetical protein
VAGRTTRLFATGERNGKKLLGGSLLYPGFERSTKGAGRHQTVFSLAGRRPECGCCISRIRTFRPLGPALEKRYAPDPGIPRFCKGWPVISLFKYWEEGEYDADLPDSEIFRAEINRVNSHFFTLNIAQKTDGEWLIVELGDGQVAGLPKHADPVFFLSKLLNTKQKSSTAYLKADNGSVPMP